MEMFEPVLSNLLEIVVSLIGLVITAVLLPKFKAWIKTKTDNALINSVIDDLTTTVSTSVDYLEQTVVKQLKSDGTWNSDTQKEVLSKAVDEVVSNLATSTTTWLENNKNDVTATVIRYIESKLFGSKV